MADRDGAQEEIKEAVEDFTGRAKDTLNVLFGKDEEKHGVQQESGRTPQDQQGTAERVAPARRFERPADTEAPERPQQ